MTPLDDDHLERLLLSLPLDEPPAGLHARVLAATIHAPAPAPLVRPWEIWTVGTAIAVMVWLLGMVALVPAAGAAIADALTAAVRGAAGAATPVAFLWIAIGISASLWISQLTLSPVPQRKRM